LSRTFYFIIIIFLAISDDLCYTKVMKKICLLFILLIVLPTSLALGDEFSDKIASEEVKLRSLRSKLQEAVKKTEELKKSEKNILEAVSRIDEELLLTRRLLKELSNKENIISKEIDKTEKIIERLEEQKKIRSEILNRRLRAIYKKGKMHTMEILLTAKNFTDAIKRFEYLTLIAEQDKRVVDELISLKQQLEEKKKFLRTNLDEVKKINVEAEKETEFLQNRRKEKQSLLESIRQQKSQQELVARQLRESARKIQRLISKLEKERRERERQGLGENYFSKVVGNIKWPVKGRIISTFGNKINPKYGTSVKNNGIDIRAKSGTPVHSVAKGKVVYNDRFLGYGNVVLIDHGKGYYSLYAHLRDVNVNVGDMVDKDQVIGTVGDTGSLEGPKLHFEIRKNGKPIDPIPFLKNKR